MEKEEITISYKNSMGQDKMDNLYRSDAVDLFLMLGEQLYSTNSQFPPKSGAPKQLYPMPPVKVDCNDVIYYASH